ncbi:MAG: hypothetical protein F6K63_29680 [Moorea sp. SIO1G6]|uniref:hypothetical protein n=1 Tax=Moorena sp. SIO1G6 TaxID=2607840 RepID=UPI0013C059A1|nr:hypothetical protein [Moorena sp. SIO1G6]NET68340.1 hypothetical protein [Moorena sp. SIO1G6]
MAKRPRYVNNPSSIQPSNLPYTERQRRTTLANRHARPVQPFKHPTVQASNLQPDNLQPDNLQPDNLGQ